jgi:hypothetical protein
MRSALVRQFCSRLLAICAVYGLAGIAVAVPPNTAEKKEPKPAAAADAGDHQAELEAKLSKMLSGATLEGSYTLSGPGADGAKLAREKYTLGEVKKVAGDVWQFPARIQYGGKDVTIPILLPIRWAGDTPLVVVDEVTLPGFGTVSARVLFFNGHYAGYWKHGDHSGNLFGEIRPVGEAGEKDKAADANKEKPAPSRGNQSPGKQP